MKVWTRRHDFSSSGDSTVTSVDEAVAMLRNFNWESEIQKEQAARANGTDCCPAGMGLISQNKDILHIIPGRGDAALIHFCYARRKSLLGIFHWDSETLLSVADFPSTRLTALMERHFAADRAAVVAMLSTEGKPLN